MSVLVAWSLRTARVSALSPALGTDDLVSFRTAISMIGVPALTFMPSATSTRRTAPVAGALITIIRCALPSLNCMPAPSERKVQELTSVQECDYLDETLTFICQLDHARQISPDDSFAPARTTCEVSEWRSRCQMSTVPIISLGVRVQVRPRWRGQDPSGPYSEHGS